MPPNVMPTHRRVPTFHNDGAKRNAMALFGNAMAKLVIVGKTIGQRGETAGFSECFTAHENGRAERKIERLDAGGLQNHAPEIGVDGDCFPAHGGRSRIGEAVKTIDQTDF